MLNDDHGLVASNDFHALEMNTSRSQTFKKLFESRLAWCNWRRHVSKIRWTSFTNNANVLFSNSVPEAMSCGVLYTFHRHILSTVEVNKYGMLLSAFIFCYVGSWRVLLFSRRILLRSMSLMVPFRDSDLAIMAVARFETLVLSQVFCQRDGNSTVILIICRLLFSVGRWGLRCDLNRVHSSSLLSVPSSTSSLL